MQTGQDNNDGSDIFWPGYVDATTNLILNLLFLLTILIVAVFMFALELGRSSKVEVENPPLVATKPAEEVLFKSITDLVKEKIPLTKPAKEDLSKAITDLVKENVALTKQDGEDLSKAITDLVKENVALTKQDGKDLSKAITDLVKENVALTKQDGEDLSKATTDPVKENVALKLEIERVSKMLVQLVSAKKDGEVVPKARADYAKENIELKSGIQRLSKMLAQLPSSIQGVEAVSIATTDHAKENIELKREIERLNNMLAHQVPQNVKLGGLEKNIDVTLKEIKPLEGLDKTHISDFEIAVLFKDEAIAFTPEDRSRLLKILKPVVERGKSNIYVEIPAGFSEAKRMAFYRAMAVRNLLIEMKMPKENINVSVVEGKSNANASLVKVR